SRSWRAACPSSTWPGVTTSTRPRRPRGSARRCCCGIRRMWTDPRHQPRSSAVTSKIRNIDALCDIGDRESRRIVLAITERVLHRLDAYQRIKSIMKRDRDILTIGTRSWDLSTKPNVYLTGAGKASNHMAMAIDEILGDRLTRGIAIVKIAEDTDRFHRTEVHEGGHPIPNEAGHRASLAILELADNASADDLFIAV